VRYGEPIVSSRVVGAVDTLAGAPALSQLAAGDTITTVNGTAVHSWNEVAAGIARSAGDTIAIRTHRGEVRVPVGRAGQPSATDVARAIDVLLPPVIGDVVPGTPAARAGLRAGDSVVAIAGAPLRGWSDLLERVSASPGVDLRFEIVRGGQRVPMTLRPESTTVQDPSSKQPRIVGRIGAYNATVSTREPMPVGRAFTVALDQTWATGTQIVDVVRGLLTRQISVNQLGGPIAITRASVAAAKSGLETLLGLIAMLSVNVAVLNLLPIPILDGGQILLNVAEAAKGQPFSMRTREYILRVGLVLILMIFVLSTFNDLKAVLSRLFA